MVTVEEDKITGTYGHTDGRKGTPEQAHEGEEHHPGELVSDEEQFAQHIRPMNLDVIEFPVSGRTASGMRGSGQGSVSDRGRFGGAFKLAVHRAEQPLGKGVDLMGQHTGAEGSQGESPPESLQESRQGQRFGVGEFGFKRGNG